LLANLRPAFWINFRKRLADKVRGNFRLGRDGLGRVMGARGLGRAFDAQDRYLGCLALFFDGLHLLGWLVRFIEYQRVL
jgi:hypothetical protein